MEIYSRQAVKDFVILKWFLPKNLFLKSRSFVSLRMTLLALCFFSVPVFAADIQGVINIEPPYPEIKAVKVVKKVKDSCSDVRKPEGLLVSETGGVQNAVIWLEGNFKNEYPTAGATPVFNQQACRFEPHVVIVPVGKEFQIKNSDPLAHDIRGFDGAKMLFRFEMGEGDKPVPQNFKKPGIYLLRCGFHTWMHAIAVSAPHAYYAVSDAQGQFTLKAVPEGSYKVHVWHETLGEAEGNVQVSGQEANFSYTFKAH